MNKKQEAIQQAGEAQHELIINEATCRGVECLDVSNEHGKLATRLILNGREELIVEGIPDSWIKEKTSLICDEKQLTKELFKQLEIPSPKSYLFTNPNELDPLNLFDDELEYVCKPTVGTNGIGVVLNLRSIDDVRDYYAANSARGSEFLLEEMYNGYDLRIQVIGGKIVAACIRIPAQITGNGNHTLQQLIDARRKIVQLQNPANVLNIDEESIHLITEQGFKLSCVIPEGTNISLKKISNMAQGGHAIDVTGEISAVVTFWVDKIVNELKTGYFALDLMCKQHEAYYDGAAVAIEINARAEWMHHTFSEVRTHDLAKTVIDVLFPDK
ncbi:MAG: cyanophycin synthetase [Crocinitomicaceae bacterium]|jgi:cyanophycin synthetase